MISIKKLHLISRNRQWLSSSISLHDKLTHYPAALFALLFNSRSLKYLGRKFQYDNYATPVSIQAYPPEIDAVLSNMSRKPKYILDIGGNLGQFSITLKRSLPNAVIDIFEPNPTIYDSLVSNTSELEGVKTYNLAVGREVQNTKLNFVSGKSATGSMFKDNATGDPKELNSITIDVTDNIRKFTKRKNYDLIKIDVEGFERNVIDHLSGVTTDYLFVEVSGTAREKDFTHSEIFDLIYQTFGSFDICYITPFAVTDDNFELLIKFEKSV